MTKSPHSSLKNAPPSLLANTFGRDNADDTGKGWDRGTAARAPGTGLRGLITTQVSFIWWGAWSKMDYSRERVTPEWFYICQNECWAQVAPEKGNMPTLRAPATLLHSSLSFCLLFPYPLWPGLAISSPSEPCLPVSVHAQDNPSSPAHIQKHTVYSS